MNINFKKPWSLAICISVALLTVPAEAEELEWDPIECGLMQGGGMGWIVPLIIPSRAKNDFEVEVHQVVDGKTAPYPGLERVNPQAFPCKPVRIGVKDRDFRGHTRILKFKLNYKNGGVMQPPLWSKELDLTKATADEAKPGLEWEGSIEYGTIKGEGAGYEVTLNLPSRAWRQFWIEYYQVVDGKTKPLPGYEREPGSYTKSIKIGVADKNFTGDTRMLKMKVVYVDDKGAFQSLWSKEIDLRAGTAMAGLIAACVLGGFFLVTVVAVGCCVHKRNKQKRNRQQPVKAKVHGQVYQTAQPTQGLA